jgi:quercetin dioxygenase-like cupin family protein
MSQEQEKKRIVQYSLSSSEVKTKNTANGRGEASICTFTYPEIPPQFGYFKYMSIMYSYPQDDTESRKYMINPDYDIMLFVVDGTGWLMFKSVDLGIIALTPRSLIMIPRGTAHRYELKEIGNLMLFVASTSDFSVSQLEIV